MWARLGRTVAAALLGLLWAAGHAPSVDIAATVGAPERRPRQSRADRRPERLDMVEQQLLARDITDPRVIDAIRRVPRDRFVPAPQRDAAYEDRPLPIGYRQTISQPYIVAFMTQALQLTEETRVLEIGTGSGYQTAVLAELAAQVYSIEIVPELGVRARETLADLGHANVETRVGDGYQGWPDAAPFDAIIVTAAPDHVPEPLIAQLAPGGRMVIPVGQDRQSLTLITRGDDGITRRNLLPVLFVPMTGEAERR
jgi:protein-L-isoaspartate(D-aspartate) O-methyltransferase